MQCCPHSVKCVGTTWRISGDECYIFIVLFCRYTNHVSVSHNANHGDECELPPTISTSLICGKNFSFGEEQI
jgi:hypothetical protein